MTIIIVLLLIAIVIALFSGVFFLVRDPATSQNRRTLKALTWRVSLQVALILFLILAYFQGWIRPHGVLERPGAPAPAAAIRWRTSSIVARTASRSAAARSVVTSSDSNG